MPSLIALALLQAAPTPLAPPAQQAPVGETVAAETGEAPLTHDSRGRPVMPVEINGRGPFPMVVDTAAQTSLMAPGLAGELMLQPLPGGLTVAGATGAARSRLYPVDRMRNPVIDARHVALVELPNSGVTEARGIIGMERFAERQLWFDRLAGMVRAMPSGAAGAGFAPVTGRRTAEGFVEVPLTVDGVQVWALVDSGAAVSILNDAAFRLLGWPEGDPRIGDGGEIRGAAATSQKARSARIGKLSVGRIGLSNVPLVIADDGQRTPSMILGSDILNLFPGYAVDFPRAELRIQLPRTPIAKP